MKLSLMKLLECPSCRGALSLDIERQEREEVREGAISCRTCRADYRIVRSVPRFVDQDHYANAFSFEWNKHRTTQLDSVNRRTDSEDRLRATLGFPLEELKGKLVLDVGCGTGRFAEIVLKYGGEVVGVDLSFAVDAAFKNVGEHSSMHILQADVFRLPLRAERFDLVYSLGVLHHTPDCKKAFSRLPRYVKPGGRTVITVYSRTNKVYVAVTDLWRKLTTRLPKRLLYALMHVAIPLYYLYRIPGFRYIGLAVFPISMDPRWRWRVLDTFDCYSPPYQSYHTYPEVFRWFEEAGYRKIRVLEPAVTVVGEKPAER